jgi:hypothetical protein
MKSPYHSGKIQLGKEAWDIPGSKNFESSTERGGKYIYESTIYRNKEEYDQYDQPLQDYFASKKQERLDKDLEKRLALKESKDYEKMAKDQLLRIYEKWSNANGKRLTNIKVATKDKLIELIKKYKMDE